MRMQCVANAEAAADKQSVRLMVFGMHTRRLGDEAPQTRTQIAKARNSTGGIRASRRRA